MRIFSNVVRNKAFLFTVLGMIAFIIYLGSNARKQNNAMSLKEDVILDLDRSKTERVDKIYNRGYGDKSDVEPQLPVYKHEYVASFSRFDIGQARLEFLKNFRTPCFLEDNTGVPNVYRQNRMITSPTYVKKGLFVNGILSGKPSFIKLPGMNKAQRLRCLPHFMLLGSAKSGTTDFTSRVQIHPLVFRGMAKELYWWNQYRVIINSTLSDYSDMIDKGITDVLKFPAYDTDIVPLYPGVIGEMTSITISDVAYWREDPRNKGLKEPKYLTPHDVYKLNPTVKLILILRNPTARLYSHYNMFRSNYNPSPQDFHMRVVASIKWWSDCINILPERGCVYGSPPEMPLVEHQLSSWWKMSTNYSGTIREGIYYYFVKDWLSVFPKENFLFIRSEDYNNDKLFVMNEQVFPFLGIHKVEGREKDLVENMKNTYSRKYPPMLPETKQLLNQFYSKYNQQLADILGDEKWTWKDVS